MDVPIDDVLAAEVPGEVAMSADGNCENTKSIIFPDSTAVKVSADSGRQFPAVSLRTGVVQRRSGS